MLHVDDMLFTGTSFPCNLFIKCIGSLAHSPVQFLSTENSLTFCVADITLNIDRTIELSQEAFYPKLSLPQAQDIIRDSRFVTSPDKTARLLETFVGGCIWLFQTRYDILFEVCNLASNITLACASVGDLKLFLKDAKDAYKRFLTATYHYDITGYLCRMATEGLS